MGPLLCDCCVEGLAVGFGSWFGLIVVEQVLVQFFLLSVFILFVLPGMLDHFVLVGLRAAINRLGYCAVVLSHSKHAHKRRRLGHMGDL